MSVGMRLKRQIKQVTLNCFDIDRHGLVPNMKIASPLVLKHTPQPPDPRLRDSKNKHFDYQANGPLIPLNYTLPSSASLDPSMVKYPITHNSPPSSPFPQE